MAIEHPMRNAALHCFERIDSDGTGWSFIAQFHPYSVYPVFFPGKTAEAAIASAESFRADTLEKNERAFIAKKTAIEKARASRNIKARKDADNV